MDDDQHDRGLTRSSLLRRAGAAATILGVAGLAGCGEGDRSGSGAAQLSTDVDARADLPYPPPQRSLDCHLLAFFTPHEAQTVEAIAIRFVPGTPGDPGAREACVTGFIDQKLAAYESFATPTYFRPPFAKPVDNGSPGAQEHVPPDEDVLVAKDELPRYGFQAGLTPQQTYRAGIEQLDGLTRALDGRAFVELDGAGQDDLLELLEAFGPLPSDPKKKAAQLAAQESPTGKAVAQAFAKPSAYGFFSTLLEDTYEGMFSDPVYGGNRGYSGWLLVGYPGAQRAYTPHELTAGPQGRTVQGLRDLMPMHPGNPATHVILPLAGTRRTER